MIAYKCDSCGEEIDDRKVAKIDGKEYDLCAKCYGETVGKLTSSNKGRFVFDSGQQLVYTPWFWHQPFYVQPQPIYNPSHWPTIYGNDGNTAGCTYTMSTTSDNLLVV